MWTKFKAVVEPERLRRGAGRLWGAPAARRKNGADGGASFSSTAIGLHLVGPSLFHLHVPSSSQRRNRTDCRGGALAPSARTGSCGGRPAARGPRTRPRLRDRGAEAVHGPPASRISFQLRRRCDATAIRTRPEAELFEHHAVGRPLPCEARSGWRRPPTEFWRRRNGHRDADTGDDERARSIAGVAIPGPRISGETSIPTRWELEARDHQWTLGRSDQHSRRRGRVRNC